MTNRLYVDPANSYSYLKGAVLQGLGDTIGCPPRPFLPTVSMFDGLQTVQTECQKYGLLAAATAECNKATLAADKDPNYLTKLCVMNVKHSQREPRMLAALGVAALGTVAYFMLRKH